MTHKLAVGGLVVDRLADRELAFGVRVEAALELVERVRPAADPAAQMEELEARLARPAGRLVEDEVARTEPPPFVARGAQVIVQPRLRREAEHRCGQLLA